MIKLKIVDTEDTNAVTYLSDLTELGRQQIRYEAQKLIEEIDEFEEEPKDDEPDIDNDYYPIRR